MMKSILPLSFGLGLAAAAPLSAYAQGPSDFETKYVEHIQLQHPDFRIVKKMETFPERYNASVKLPILASTPSGSKTKRAFVTLHDGVTGEPMESCYAPCTLHLAQGTGPEGFHLSI